jgi:hypothetical protein
MATVPEGVTDRIPTARQLGDDCDPRRQARQMAGQMQVEGSTIPPGIVVWWTHTKNAIPYGWGLMDGVDNSPARGGTGIVLVNKFVLASASGAGQAGEEEDRYTTEGGEHTHSVDIGYTKINEPNVSAYVVNGSSNVTFSPSKHTHTGETGDSLDVNTNLDGQHTHKGKTDKRKIKLELDGDHTHKLIGLETDETTVEKHEDGDIVQAIADHDAHRHTFTLNNFDADAGATTVRWPDSPSGPNTTTLDHDPSGTDVTHDPHDHELDGGVTDRTGGHTHPMEPHEHQLRIPDSGEHQHVVGAHRHEVTITKDDAHDHNVSDPQHGHEVTTHVDPHSHGSHIDRGGNHKHKTGHPLNMKLLPIEKLRT